ncbi:MULTISPECIES: bifunctional precorrin-2 dehydrogenase/sirohydrochlorin ferrochelatase [Dyadobacter]|uniref:precorrin-2 dehydrogenase n=1 Tax=Dyadobacter chenhuakuii TaxID=2909339 RepID=A0ABY4XEL3_9BACT|nr:MULTISPECIES: bifunctional precorrin-2 dehydrogenase/sirohydrochlorin ferrochelatase [Dyadobacter]MCF2491988.1 bifunctional precorrin-2 dehydrogenase/sirohydrochlorin ferrochelatase [Dyadobacter chenhuakuii]MCF2516625.1 bifunctional precorrin-2 dehydrogenase/sirohydrochlorin ferrochelatase [Dyadobacter sp. CY351]USJ28851.1 bifunctional precorrin-2 dehydrogenase/sirohydrochlorin ferrochelatase [Dyadobacter chenhuakuii]
MNNLFPIFLKLENLHTLIVGGGYVGLEKITAVLDNSPLANVTLVSPDIRQEIRDIANLNSRISLIERRFEDADLDTKDMVIVATNDKLENARIAGVARSRNMLVNVADTPAICDFYLSSVVRKGNLKVAISTNGMSPTLAKRLKEVLGEALPDNLETAMEQLKAVRDMLKGDFAFKVEELNRITSVLTEKKK